MSNKTKERHILALSGGKDSAALAVYMRENYPDLDMEYVFTDSGCELPETYEYLNRIRAILNIDITVVKPERDFDYWLKYYNGMLPSPQNRWCTRQLKIRPYELFIGSPKTFSYVAIRADEDRGGYINKKGNIVPQYPFIEDGIVLNDVIDILDESGLGLPKYYKWRKRSGCFFCFYQTENEWKALKKHHPRKFEMACQYEENHADGRTYTWRGKLGKQIIYLRDLESYASVMGKVVVSEGKSHKKLSQIIEEAGLCFSDNGGVLR